jgi:hypothetical protein
MHLGGANLYGVPQCRELRAAQPLALNQKEEKNLIFGMAHS